MPKVLAGDIDDLSGEFENGNHFEDDLNHLK